MGMMSFKARDFLKAAAFFQLSLKTLPQTVAHYAHLRQKLLKGGKVDFAGLALLLINQAREDEEDVYELLARCYFHLRDFSKMKGVVFRGLKQFPDSGVLRFHLGLAHFMLAEFPPALAAFDRAVERSPGDADSHYYRALCRQNMNQPELFDVYSRRTLALQRKRDSFDDPERKLHFHADLMMLRYVTRTMKGAR
jgi:tetratricopeptide (TPR) repeat protein